MEFYLSTRLLPVQHNEISLWWIKMHTELRGSVVSRYQYLFLAGITDNPVQPIQCQAIDLFDILTISPDRAFCGVTEPKGLLLPLED